MALDTPFIAAVAAIFVLVGVLVAVFIGLQGGGTKGETQAPSASTSSQQEESNTVVSASGRRNAASRMQARRNRNAATASERSNAARTATDGDDDGDDGSDSEAEETQARLPMNKKERNKADKQAEKEAKRAAIEARENKLPTAYEERRRKKEEEAEATRKAQEEEMKRAAEERQKQEDEEAAKWMGMISVDQEGTGEGDDMEENQGLLGQFVDYIKQRKTVPLEQLATEFKLRTTDVIDRIQGLEAMGRITGVMDERGKFIYISKEEMEAVANFINTKGRVAISDLAAKSNQFIDLEAKQAEANVGPEPAIDFDSLVEPEAAA